MRSLSTLIRVRKWELEEKRRKLNELRALQIKLAEAIAKLGEEVQSEQGVASSHNEVTFAYGPYAAAVVERRRTLEESALDVERQIEAAMEEVAEAFAELKKYEIAQTNRRAKERSEANRREQIVLDDIAIESFRRDH
jgi:flagellar FliJ protein